MRLTRALTTLNELGLATRRLGASIYQYRLPSVWRQAYQSIAGYVRDHYRLMVLSYYDMLDAERFFYAEGGFLIAIPKSAQRSLTDCTSCVSGAAPFHKAR